MANGFQHAKATRRNGIIITAISVGSCFVYGPLPLLFVPGAWLGHMITPDFDLSEAHPIHVQRMLINKYKILGWIIWAFWLPYAKLCVHRGMSHSYPVGTLVRMIYTLWIPSLLLYIYRPEWFTPDVIVAWYAVLFCLFVTWSIQDVTHLWMDTKFYKKHFLKSAKN